MEKDSKSSSVGMEFVLSSLNDARTKLAKMRLEDKLRSPDEIWEAYCDIEQAIEVSKFVFGLHNRLGVARTLRVSAKNDPETIPLGELAEKYGVVDSSLVSACEAYKKGNAEFAIDLARRARDELKILLLGNRKKVKSKRGKK
jgi:hypothetical protein